MIKLNLIADKQSFKACLGAHSIALIFPNVFNRRSKNFLIADKLTTVAQRLEHWNK